MTDAALKYVKRSGLATMGDYGYTGQKGACRAADSYATVKVRVWLTPGACWATPERRS
jgi:hypothetical protein